MSRRRITRLLRYAFQASFRANCRIEKLMAQGDFETALSTAEEAGKRWPRDNGILARCAEAHNAFENKDEVVAACDAIDLTHAGRDFMLHVARLYRSAGSLDKAHDLFEEICDRFECPVSNLGLALMHYKSGDIDPALYRFIKATVAGGNVTWPHAIESIRDAGDSTVADCVGLLEAYLQNEKEDDYRARKILSMLQLRQNDKKTAIENMWKSTQCYFRQIGKPEFAGSQSGTTLPRCLIIGAMKCGTTTLHHLLGQHPKAVLPADKELQFFQYQHLDEDWYLANFPQLDDDDGWFTLEASPGYYIFEIIDRVKELLPDVKLLFISRDPVKRAISHIRHNKTAGLSAHETARALGRIDWFEKMLMDSPDGAEKAVLDVTSGRVKGNSYLVLGLYELLLRRWRKAFGPDQLMTLRLEELTANPQSEIDRVCDFLGVDRFPVRLERLNQGSYSRDGDKLVQIETRLRRFYERIAGSVQSSNHSDSH